MTAVGITPVAAERAQASRVALAHLLSLAIGIVAFFCVLNVASLLAEAPFLARPIGDFAAEQASYVLVANDIWRFPFLALPQVNLPEGANAVFFGGTPLLALVARVWRELTGAANAPNLLGFWYLLCFALQSHSLFFLMRQITRRRPILLALASAAGVFAYAFLTRFGHVSLFGEFLVIYAMGLTLATLRPEVRWQSALLWLAAVAAVAMLIFAYLAVSIATLYGAALVTLWWSRRARLPSLVAAGAGFGALLLLIAWGSGYFWAAARAEPVDMSSYASLGLNIGGLVIPPQSPLFPHHPLFRDWWEGDFYLGLGPIALLLLAVVVRPRATWRGLVRHWPMVAIFGLLTLYALSNRWAFGNTVILEYPLPQLMAPIVGLARAGGRLFWPIGYLIIGLAFALTVSRFGRAGAVLVVAALALCGVEATDTLAYVRRTALVPNSFPLDYGGLQRVMDAHPMLRVYPSFWCGPGADGSTLRVVHWQLQITSARAHQSSNTAITVRKMKDCAREAADMPHEILRPGDLDVFLSKAAFSRAFSGREGEQAAHCREFEMQPVVGYMCAQEWAADTAIPLRELTPITDRSAGFAQSRRIDFSRDGNWETFAVSGFWQTSDGPFTWTEGPDARLDLTVPPLPHAQLSFSVLPFTAPGLPMRTVTVTAGDRLLATWTFDNGDWTVKDADIPPDLTGKPLQLVLHESETPSPKELGLSEDPRHLGLAIRSIRLLSGP